MSILIRNATVVTAQTTYFSDIGVSEGKISGIGVGLKLDAETEIDASGMYVCPGGVDPHCHLGDDFENASKAAACGGTTCVIEPSVQEPGKSLTQALESWQEKARNRAAIDFGFHVTIVDPNSRALDEIPRLVDLGVLSFKIFMASFPGTPMLDDGSMLEVFSRVRRAGGIVILHAENGHIIDFLTKKSLSAGRRSTKDCAACHPRSAESEAVSRAILLASLTSAPVFFYHISCMSALDVIRKARSSGSMVYAETCPHYLFLTEQVYEQGNIEGAKYLCAPPLRDNSDQKELWKALVEGGIQVVSSDHVGLNIRSQKELADIDFTKIPLGIPGIGTRVPLMFSAALAGRVSLSRFVDLVSTAPAKLFGLYPRKGEIQVGSDGDLVVFDPTIEEVMGKSSFCQTYDYSPYEGFRLKGAPRFVIARGEVVAANGAYVGRPGAGQYLVRSAASTAV